MEKLPESLRDGSWNNLFSHIYIEREAMGYTLTHQILERLPKQARILINHYKDVFCKQGQCFSAQKKSPALILAVNHGSFLYEGSPYCDSFGHSDFFTMSFVMNCVYDCRYCYLQGLYPSANIVVFVNAEDGFARVEERLADKPLYLCVSYDTDLPVLEAFTGFTGRWIEMAARFEGLTVEIRTKSANTKVFATYSPITNVIPAWTLSPREIIKRYEERTPSLENRLRSISSLQKMGWHVRLCFDPILYVKGWEDMYDALIHETFRMTDPSMITEISAGVFRVPAVYLKKMEKMWPNEELFAYPFENGSYRTEHKEEVMGFIRNALSRYVDEDRIFVN